MSHDPRMTHGTTVVPRPDTAALFELPGEFGRHLLYIASSSLLPQSCWNAFQPCYLLHCRHGCFHSPASTHLLVGLGQRCLPQTSAPASLREASSLSSVSLTPWSPHTALHVLFLSDRVPWIGSYSLLCACCGAVPGIPRSLCNELLSCYPAVNPGVAIFLSSD